MNLEQLIEIARPYGVKGINLGGCVEGQAKGFKGAMRRSGHAHNSPKWHGEWYGWICIKSSKIEKLLTPSSQPNQLFWHEVSHIYKRSRSQKDCDDWAWQMVRNGGKEKEKPSKEQVKKQTTENHLAKARKMVKLYETKLKRTTTLLKKWQRKEKHYAKKV